MCTPLLLSHHLYAWEVEQEGGSRSLHQALGRFYGGRNLKRSQGPCHQSSLCWALTNLVDTARMGSGNEKKTGGGVRDRLKG